MGLNGVISFGFGFEFIINFNNFFLRVILEFKYFCRSFRKIIGFNRRLIEIKSRMIREIYRGFLVVIVFLMWRICFLMFFRVKRLGFFLGFFSLILLEFFVFFVFFLGLEVFFISIFIFLIILLIDWKNRKYNKV